MLSLAEFQLERYPNGYEIYLRNFFNIIEYSVGSNPLSWELYSNVIICIKQRLKLGRIQL